MSEQTPETFESAPEPSKQERVAKIADESDVFLASILDRPLPPFIPEGQGPKLNSESPMEAARRIIGEVPTEDRGDQLQKGLDLMLDEYKRDPGYFDRMIEQKKREENR